MILGVDVGGTFTDFVLLDPQGQIQIHKLLTSADDQSQAILQGIRDLESVSDATIIHGATVATNALLERRGARTALITTQGFRDVLEIGRQTRPDLYALHPVRPAPLVPAEQRFEVPERVDHKGRIVVALDLKATDQVVQHILASDVESVAVCLLFSFLNPEHERQIQKRFQEIGQDASPLVSLSSKVLPEFREYERTTTTVINAYVAPLMDRYLGNLENRLEGRRLRIMQSNGGILSAESARSQSARTALSGPAGGVVGAFEIARMAGFPQAITFDMGGTSTDVSLCPNKIQETTEGTIAGLPLRLPIIDIHTVGAGGGSLARTDAGAALRVGPASAGSDPGPVCYGNPDASEITVTDANLILGRLDRDHFLGGRMDLDVERTKAHMQSLARQLSLPLEAAAWGVIRVANSNMERAIRTISVERGHDPRRFTLVAFGGAGPLHACELATALRIPRVLIPPFPGVLSAMGMVLADVVKDYSQTVMLSSQAIQVQELDRLFEPLFSQAQQDLYAEGLRDESIQLLPALDIRYVGQSFEVVIDITREGGRFDPGVIDKAVDAFHTAHEQRFSYANRSAAVEVVNLRLKAVGSTNKPHFAQAPSGRLDPKRAQLGYKQVHFADRSSPRAARPILTALYERAKLEPGNMVVGPAIIFQLDTTSVIPPGWAATVDGWHNLVVENR